MLAKVVTRAEAVTPGLQGAPKTFTYSRRGRPSRSSEAGAFEPRPLNLTRRADVLDGLQDPIVNFGKRAARRRLARQSQEWSLFDERSRDSGWTGTAGADRRGVSCLCWSAAVPA